MHRITFVVKQVHGPAGPCLGPGEPQPRRSLGRLLRVLLPLLALLALIACSPEGRESENLPSYRKTPAIPRGAPVYRMALPPLANVKRVYASHLPLVESINARVTGFSVRLVVPQNYTDLARRLQAGEFSLALVDPAQTTESLRYGYRVAASTGDGDSSRGLIILRNDSDIRAIRDLEGRPLSFPAAGSFTSTLLPKSFLHEWSVDLSACPMRYVGSAASALMSVYFGKTEAAGIGLMQWQQFTSEHPDISSSLKIGWVTEPFIADALIIHDGMPRGHARQVTEALLSLHEIAEGRDALQRIGLPRFTAASNDEYRPAAEFIRRNAAVFSHDPQPPLREGIP